MIIDHWVKYCSISDPSASFVVSPLSATRPLNPACNPASTSALRRLIWPPLCSIEARSFLRPGLVAFLHLRMDSVSTCIVPQDRRCCWEAVTEASGSPLYHFREEASRPDPPQAPQYRRQQDGRVKNYSWYRRMAQRLSPADWAVPLAKGEFDARSKVIRPTATAATRSRSEEGLRSSAEKWSATKPVSKSPF